MLPVGWVCAFVFPIVGFVIGCALPKQYSKRQAWMILASLGAALFWYLAFSGLL